MFTDEQNVEQESVISFVPKEGDHYCDHHRKPRDLGGTNYKRNRSKVLRSRHTAWHTLYEVMPANQIILTFQDDCEIFGDWNPRSPLLTKIIEGYANSNRKRIRRREAWFFLFEGMSLEDIVQEINGVWLDPDYVIRVGTDRIKKVWITTSLIKGSS